MSMMNLRENAFRHLMIDIIGLICFLTILLYTSNLYREESFMTKYINVKSVSACTIILVLFIILYRIFIRDIIFADIVNIEVQSLTQSDVEAMESYYRYDMELNDNQVKDIVNKPFDYKFMKYEFSLRNVSKSKRASFIGIKPLFTKDMKKNVVGFTEKDGESPISIYPLKKFDYIKYVLIKINGYTDGELVELAKKDKFLVTGFTGNMFIDIGYNLKLVEFTKK